MSSAQEIMTAQLYDLNQHITQYINHLKERTLNAPESRFYLGQLLTYIKDAHRPTFANHGEIRSRVKLIDLGNPASSTREMSRIVDPHDATNNPHVVVFEGFPAPSDIGYIGARFNVPAEAFLGHLEFERVQMRDRTSYELPALPSRCNHVVHVRLVRLGRSLLSTDQAIVHGNDRQLLRENVVRHERDLFSNRDYGTTRFRNIHGQTERYFIIEQLVTFSVVAEEGKPWTGTCHLLLNVKNEVW